jgi:hypothetical protein
MAAFPASLQRCDGQNYDPLVLRRVIRKNIEFRGSRSTRPKICGPHAFVDMVTGREYERAQRWRCTWAQSLR